MVPVGETLQEAVRALQRNKMRTALTMLGVVIGVASVIATFAIGQGAKATVQEQIRSLGSNVIMVFSGPSQSGGVRSATGESQGLTPEDALAIAKECPSVRYASPTTRTQAQVVFEEQNWNTVVQGGDQNYLTVRDWPLSDGRGFTVSDVRAAAKVCIIGSTVAQELFGDASPIGSVIRIKNLPFQVIGTLRSKGSTSWGQDQDDIVVAPLPTVQQKLQGNRRRIRAILVSAISEQRVDQAIDEISALLRQRHRLQMGEPDDFMVRSQAEIASTAASTSQAMTLLLSSIALVSLLVGGIGIMNIMLVSVTERTREIGVRRAIGARATDILVQFLAESALVSLIGGAFGVCLGIGVAELVSKIAQWPTLIVPESIVIAFAFSAMVGLFFGYYPARTAAKLVPMEALRYE